jgi:hypothetical protein
MPTALRGHASGVKTHAHPKAVGMAPRRVAEMTVIQ